MKKLKHLRFCLSVDLCLLMALSLGGTTGCFSWHQDAQHPHRTGLQRPGGVRFPAHPTMRAEWRLELGLSETFSPQRNYTGGAALHEREPLLAIIAHDQHLWLVHRDSGRVIWREEVGSVGIGHPVFVGDVLYAPTEDGKLSAYHVRDRKLLWRRQFAGLISSPMTIGDQLIYLCDGNNRVYAVQRDTGRVRWQHQHRVAEDKEAPNSYQFSLHGEASPKLNGEQLFVGYSDGRVRAFNALNGEVMWTRDLAPQNNRFEDVDADLVVVGDTLYGASAASGLYALSTESGEVRWFYPLEGVISLAPLEGDLIIGMQHGELGRFNPFNRSFTWRVTFGSDGVPRRVIHFPYGIAVTLSRGGLYVLDAQSGELRDQFSSGSASQEALVLSADGWLYTTTQGGFLYAFSPR